MQLEVLKLLKSVGIREIEKLEIPPQPEFGDLAFPCFELAKKEKRNPKEVAEEIVKKIKIPKGSLISKVEAKAGYVNFFFNWEKLSEKILKKIKKGIKPKIGKGKKVMVEYSQPNPVHPMHIGHARGTFLGEALANIFDFLGYKVIRANYMNDVGLQVAKLVAAYNLWAKNKKPKGKPDFWLWQYYIKFHEEVSKNPQLEEKAREILRKLEIEKEKKVIKIWRQIVRWCIKGFEQTYKRLGIKFDVYFFESDFRDLGKKIVEMALEKNVAFKSPDKTIVSNLEKYGIPNLVLLRSDGTGLYQTSDLGLTVYKFKKYKLNKSIWVVSSQQILHFKQVFKLLELLGYPWIKNAHHFYFEHVVLPEGKMSSREGRAVMLDEVINKLVEMAYDEVDKRNPNLSKEQKRNLAEKIGIGALKYSVLKIEPENQITFDWKQMLSFEGNTAPYLQYAHTRCKGILKKADKWKPNFKIEKLAEEEKKLVKILARFSEIVEKAAKDLRPHYICNFAYELATAFDKFYEFCPVLKAENEKLKNFRLTLVDTTRIILEKSLNLIGIEVPEKM
ncbi:MAG: arginine--tRNA ligase [Candidatus Nanoarchaeia archaeon]